METIWQTIHPALNHIQKERRDGLPVEVRAGLNFCIILGSACYLEGVLEAGLKSFLWMRRDIYNKSRSRNINVRRSMNCWFNRVEEDMELRIRTATGAEGYNELFELLIGRQLSELEKIAPLWEGITVLFQLRNVLGHGREVKAYQIVSVTPIEEKFQGGYRRAEDYLRKRKLINKKFTDAHSDFIFLSDAVADHFLDLVEKVPKAISQSLMGKDTRWEMKWFASAVS